ncbi:hypothetical protein Adt_31704 [Abeliophyllum distichum]|uniref:Uncharacterized protein n=1 Tax=Abeliophyllum distichum TaxID=126358 RepID=A0ABD1REW0_9LAMI
MSHEGDGAGDPPHQPPHQLDSSCESGYNFRSNQIFCILQTSLNFVYPNYVFVPFQPPRLSDGVFLEALTLRRFGRPTGRGHFPSHIVERTMQAIENNTKYFTRLVGNQMRFTVSLFYPSWIDVLEEQRARLHSIIEEQSTKNKANRGKAKYPGVQGSKSFSAMRCDVRAIANEVLGERLGHVCGVGRVPKRTSPSLDSTDASKAPQGTFHQFSGDPQNDNLRFAMYEAQLCRMLQEIELLKNSIPVFVPEEDKNEDKDEGLGRGRGFGGSVDF